MPYNPKSGKSISVEEIKERGKRLSYQGLEAIYNSRAYSNGAWFFAMLEVLKLSEAGLIESWQDTDGEIYHFTKKSETNANV